MEFRDPRRGRAPDPEVPLRPRCPLSFASRPRFAGTGRERASEAIRGAGDETQRFGGRAVPGRRVPDPAGAVLGGGGGGPQGGPAAALRRAAPGELPREGERRGANRDGPPPSKRGLRAGGARPPARRAGAPAPRGGPLRPAGQGQRQGRVLGGRVAVALRLRHPPRRGRGAGAARPQPPHPPRRGERVQRPPRLHPRLPPARPRPRDPRHGDDQLPPLGGGRRHGRGAHRGGRARVRQGAARDDAHLRRQPRAQLLAQHVALAAHHLLPHPEPGLERPHPPPAPGPSAPPGPDPGRAPLRRRPARRSLPGNGRLGAAAVPEGADS